MTQLVGALLLLALCGVGLRLLVSADAPSTSMTRVLGIACLALFLPILGQALAAFGGGAVRSPTVLNVLFGLGVLLMLASASFLAYHLVRRRHAAHEVEVRQQRELARKSAVQPREPVIATPQPPYAQTADEEVPEVQW